MPRSTLRALIEAADFLQNAFNHTIDTLTSEESDHLATLVYDLGLQSVLCEPENLKSIADTLAQQGDTLRGIFARGMIEALRNHADLQERYVDLWRYAHDELRHATFRVIPGGLAPRP
jgi:hypothetical protein